MDDPDFIWLVKFIAIFFGSTVTKIEVGQCFFTWIIYWTLYSQNDVAYISRVGNENLYFVKMCKNNNNNNKATKWRQNIIMVAPQTWIFLFSFLKTYSKNLVRIFFIISYYYQLLELSGATNGWLRGQMIYLFTFALERACMDVEEKSTILHEWELKWYILKNSPKTITSWFFLIFFLVLMNYVNISITNWYKVSILKLPKLSADLKWCIFCNYQMIWEWVCLVALTS